VLLPARGASAARDAGRGHRRGAALARGVWGGRRAPPAQKRARIHSARALVDPARTVRTVDQGQGRAAEDDRPRPGRGFVGHAEPAGRIVVQPQDVAGARGRRGRTGPERVAEASGEAGPEREVLYGLALEEAERTASERVTGHRVPARGIAPLPVTGGRARGVEGDGEG